ncbi:helix-turn-helix domain-containing protein, partial [Pseudomonas sp. PA-3-11C]|uniref:helix-turn-helix domain-containing protein n=1 Tax=Pseudomonas sp. PA-3-11C TaxID=2665472 RepID=UPI001F269B2E
HLWGWGEGPPPQGASALSLDVRAAGGRMSGRPFPRRFKQATGTTVSKWLNAERVARAQALLETTELPVECIAGEVGFGTALSLRQHFAAQLGTSPSEYRKMFCLGMGESAAFVGIQ